jgi:hypothetical protein
MGESKEYKALRQAWHMLSKGLPNVEAPLSLTLDDALEKMSFTDSDRVAVGLARLYAEHLDANPGQLNRMGPQFLRVLESLRMTPRARLDMFNQGQDGGTGKESELEQYRNRKSGTGIDYASFVDSSITEANA